MERVRGGIIPGVNKGNIRRKLPNLAELETPKFARKIGMRTRPSKSSLGRQDGLMKVGPEKRTGASGKGPGFCRKKRAPTKSIQV